LAAPAVLTVLLCQPDSSAAADAKRPSKSAFFQHVVAAARDSAAGDVAVHDVGARPGKAIDLVLAGRVLVVGDDADLAAVVLRLLRKELLGEVEIAFAAAGRTPFAKLWGLPTGTSAARLAISGGVEPVPLVRDDVGGVLVGSAELGPLDGTIYVDENRVLRGPAHRLRVQPDPQKGLAVSLELRRPSRLGMLTRRSQTTLGRAVQIGTAPTNIVRDGIAYPRPMDRWTFYKHTEPLRLVRG